MNIFQYKDSSNNDITTSWEPNMTRSSSSEINDDAQKMRQMLNDLTQAVVDTGTNKAHYMKILMRHRSEWPYLWSKIDEIVSFIQLDVEE